MEQRLDASYLHPGPIERAAAAGIIAVGTGTAVLLAAWGISLLWRYTPPEIKIANPWVSITQKEPIEFAPLGPLKIDPEALNKLTGRDAKTTTGDVISREVTVFSSVKHGPGSVVTGWNYKDGSSGVPIGQYCYYTAVNPDRSSTRVDIASNRDPTPNMRAALVPELEGALAKCQWWQR
jgi:hypothetical protein